MVLLLAILFYIFGKVAKNDVRAANRRNRRSRDFIVEFWEIKGGTWGKFSGKLFHPDATGHDVLIIEGATVFFRENLVLRDGKITRCAGN